MGCMNLLGMALVGALAALVTLASSSLAAKNVDPAKPTGQKQARDQAKVDDGNQSVSPGPEPPPVSDSRPTPSKPPDTTDNQSGVSGPDVNNAKPDGGQSNPEATRPDAGGTGGSGGTAAVHTCEQPNTNITIRISEKGSSTQFGCASGFTLYPKEASKVFSKDCKKQETLKDMTRTQASAPTPPTAQDTAGQAAARDMTSAQASAPTSSIVANTPVQPPTPQTVVYTLKADTKPPKKKLCYLCARQEVSELRPGTAEDYCTIYVESGARTQLGRNLMFTLVLPCVVALL